MAGEIDTNAVLEGLLPDLHSDTFANLTFWTETQLIDYMDQAAKQLSRAAMLFVELDVSNSTVAGTATYPLPARHNATVHVSYGTSPLRPATTIEMEARDPAFQTTPGNPDHWYEDNLDATMIGIAPVPSSGSDVPITITGGLPGEMLPGADLPGGTPSEGTQAPGPTLAIICSMYPPDLDTGQLNTLLQAPAPVAVYLEYYVLWKSYSAESETEEKDLADHCAAQCALLEQLFQHLYGEGL